MAFSTLGSVVQGVGGAGAILTFIDLLMPDGLKKRLKSATETLYLQLALTKTSKWIFFLLRSRTVQMAIAISYAAVAIYFVCTDPDITAPVRKSALLESIFSVPVVLFVIHPWVLRWVDAEQEDFMYIIRLMTLIFITGGVVVALKFLVSLLKPLQLILTQYSVLLKASPIAIELSIVAFTFFFGVMVVFVLAYLSAAIKVAEFLVLRIASYEKGPVLAVSTILVAIGTILKSLT